MGFFGRLGHSAFNIFVVGMDAKEAIRYDQMAENNRMLQENQDFLAQIAEQKSQNDPYDFDNVEPDFGSSPTVEEDEDDEDWEDWPDDPRLTAGFFDDMSVEDLVNMTIGAMVICGVFAALGLTLYLFLSI